MNTWLHQKYEKNLTVKIDKHYAASWFVQLRQLVECGSKMQITIYAGEMAHFCHSLSLGKQSIQTRSDPVKGKDTPPLKHFVGGKPK